MFHLSRSCKSARGAWVGGVERGINPGRPSDNARTPAAEDRIRTTNDEPPTEDNTFSGGSSRLHILKLSRRN
jgi:hypothetical protein